MRRKAGHRSLGIRAQHRRMQVHGIGWRQDLDPIQLPSIRGVS